MDIRDLWDFNKPAESEARFRDTLLTTIDLDTQLLLKTQIARTLGLQRKFAEATALLDAVDAEMAPPPGQDGLPVTPPVVSALVRAYALLERGRVLRSSGSPELAKPYFEAARASATGIPDVLIDAIHMQAIVGTPEEALRLNNEGVVIARGSDDPRARKWLGSLYNNIAWSYHDQGLYELALNAFEQALKFHQEGGNPEKIRIANWALARCFRSIGRFGSALIMQKAILRANEPDGYVYEEIAENMAALGQVEDAKPFFAKAYEILKNDPWLQDSEPQRIQRLRGMSGL